MQAKLPLILAAVFLKWEVQGWIQQVETEWSDHNRWKYQKPDLRQDLGHLISVKMKLGKHMSNSSRFLISQAAEALTFMQVDALTQLWPLFSGPYFESGKFSVPSMQWFIFNKKEASAMEVDTAKRGP